MNFLQLIDIDWLRYLAPALGFIAFGFAKDGGDEEEEEEEEKKDDEEEEEEEEEKDKKTFDYAYVKKLREEAKSNRIKAKKLEDEKKKQDDQKLKDDGEHEKRADKIQKEADEQKTVLVRRIKLAELKSMAVSMGIIDGKLVELVDLKEVDMDDDFKTTNVKDVMEDFKEKHPKLFDDSEDDDDDREPEGNKKPGKKEKTNRGDLDKMSSGDLLRAGFSGEGKKKKGRDRT